MANSCRIPLLLRLDVLVYAEQIRRIVALLDLRQTIVILAVRRPDAILALFHHEVDVRAAGRVWMKSTPILLCPAGNFFVVRGVRIDPDYHLSPSRVSITPRRGTVLDAAGGA